MNLTLIKDKIKKIKSEYLFIFFIILIIFIATSFLLNVYPFGKNSFLWLDSDQYIAADTYFSSLLGKNNIFYSWGNVLGGNALPLLAYYCFSPLSLIFFLFKNNIVLGSQLLLLIKIELCALTFCYCLRYIASSKKISIIRIILSISYAYMGYVVFYAWNISWLDGVFLLPILYVSLDKFLKGGKPYLYVFSLAIAIISNFYIGYMLGIASGLFYLKYVFLNSDDLINTLKNTFMKYILFTFIGVGISCFLLIPAFLGLPKTRSLSIIEVFKNMSMNCKPSEILSGLFSGQINSLDTNLPLIYCGIIPVLLVVVYFLNKKIYIKEKIVEGLMLGTLFLSFSNSFINIIWHGFSQNVSFNYRYSFIFSFIFLVVAYKGYNSIESLGKDDKLNILVKSFIVVVLGIIFVLENAYGKNNYMLMMFDIACLLFVVVLFCYKNLKINGQAFLIFISVGSIIINNYALINTYIQDDFTSYKNQTVQMNKIKNIINDDGFYRMDKDYIVSRCDNLLFDYKGLTNYASTENVDNLNTVKRLGGRQIWMWGQYTSNMPQSSETLLGLKYIVTKSVNNKDYKKIGELNEEIIYLNNNALPIVFPAMSFDNNPYSEINNFEYQNNIWKSINCIDQNVFEKNNVTAISNENNIKIDVSVLNSGAIYIYIPSNNISRFNIVRNGKAEDIRYDQYEYNFYLGEYKKGDHVSLEIELEDDIDNNSIVSYSEQKEVIKQNANIINSCDINIDEISSSHLEIKYNGSSKLMATTIPYDEGWKIYDNGIQVQIKENWNNFLSFELTEAKKHNIKLIYYPKGFKIGVVVSIANLLILGCYYLYRKKLR